MNQSADRVLEREGKEIYFRCDLHVLLTVSMFPSVQLHNERFTNTSALSRRLLCLESASSTPACPSHSMLLCRVKNFKGCQRSILRDWCRTTSQSLSAVAEIQTGSVAVNDLQHKPRTQKGVLLKPNKPQISSLSRADLEKDSQRYSADVNSRLHPTGNGVLHLSLVHANAGTPRPLARSLFWSSPRV